MLIFICTGNTCRSPMAEAIAKDMFKKNGILMEVCSRGVGMCFNEKAAPHSSAAMLEYGLNLDGHVSRGLSDKEAEQAKLILTMTSAHKTYISESFPAASEKVFTLKEYVYDTNTDIVDPFGGSYEIYKKCADELYEAIELLTQKLSSNEIGGK